MTGRKAKASIELLHAVADATPLAKAGHNAAPFAADQLVAYVQRVERVEEEIKGLNGDKKEIYAEAKSNGFNVPILKQVIADRRMDKAALAEKKALLDLYHERLAELEVEQ